MPHHTVIFRLSTKPQEPLFFPFWTPTNTAQYLATCVFLILLAAITRLLLAAMQFWRLSSSSSHNHGYQKANLLGDQEPQPGDDEGDTLIPSPLPTKTRHQRQNTKRIPPTLSRIVFFAILETIIVTLGYLLMIAVMTMNIGYFCSVLAGAFLGTLVTGGGGSSSHNSSSMQQWHHC
ncbi:Ctr copper transporter [Cladorrhinum sp. PSN259]|nr:Ctr copper transporter [Cladorrhinum sp. PSN259]